MNQEQYGLLYDAINTLLFNSMNSSDGIPTFAENRHTQGVMRIQCSTPSAKQWLNPYVPYIPPLWEGMLLKVSDFSNLPKPKKILGFFRNCNAPDDMILRMLAAQNRNAWTDRWSVINRTNTNKGANITFGVDEEQLNSIYASKFTLHFGAGTALFRDISKRDNASQDEIVALDSNLEPPQHQPNNTQHTLPLASNVADPTAPQIMETNASEATGTDSVNLPISDASVTNITAPPKAPSAGGK